MARTGIALAVADVDADGVNDLLVGYGSSTGGALLLQRGVAHAFAPTLQERILEAAGQFVSPYHDEAEVIPIPVRPDLMTTADFTGGGTTDIAVAAKGDAAVYLFSGNGKAGFGPSGRIALNGRVTSLNHWRSPAMHDLLVAGICNSNECGVQLLSVTGDIKSFISLQAPVTSIEIAEVNGGRQLDLVVVAGHSVFQVSGDSALSQSPLIVKIPIADVTAATAGHFIYSYRTGVQLAVLDAANILHILSQGSLNPHQVTANEARSARLRPAGSGQDINTTHSWTEVEAVSDFGSDTGTPQILHGHFSGTGLDDIILVSAGRYIQLSHPSHVEGSVRTTKPLVMINSTDRTVTAVLPARVSADARLGLITLGPDAQPGVVVPPSFRSLMAYPVADAVPTMASQAECINGSTSCSLRSAVAVANQDAAQTDTSYVDTISLQAGTYNLSANNGTVKDLNGDNNIHLDIDASVNLIGAGPALTLINNSLNDNLLDIDSGVVNPFAPSDVFISNLTLQNGINTNSISANPSTYNNFGGLIDWTGDPTSYLTLTNVTAIGGTAEYGPGGGIAATNSQGNGTANISLINSTVSNNQTPETGGGLFVDYYTSMTITGSTFSGNKAMLSVNSSDIGAYGQGGGIGTNNNPSNSLDTITNSTFIANVASISGGALYLTNGFTISGTTVTGNSAVGGTTDPSVSGYGGGLVMQSMDTPGLITTSTFTSNTATQDGGGICLQGGTNATANLLTVHYSRFHGNSGGSGGHSAIALGCGVATVAALNATENWWGCNGAASGYGCDTEGSTAGSTGSFSAVLSPYTTLVTIPSSTSVSGGAPITATGSLGQDSSGSVYSASDSAAYVGVPAAIALTNVASTTTSGATLSSTANPSLSYAAITGMGTTNAEGIGTASATVDGTTVTTNYVVTAPDLTVSSTHTGDFKAGDGADVYSLAVSNSGSASTNGTVTVTDTLPTGFSVIAVSGSGWSCKLSPLACTRADALAQSSRFPSVTLTVAISSANVGTYTNTVTVSGGGELTTDNDSSADSTIVVSPPTIAGNFSPNAVAPNATSTLTLSVSNPAANVVSLTGVAFTDNLPSNLVVTSPVASTTCPAGTLSAPQGGTAIALSGATLTAGSSCSVSVNVTSATSATYNNVTGAVTATNSNAGGTALSTLVVSVSPTKIIFSQPPVASITAGASAAVVRVALEDDSGNIATTNSSSVISLAVTGPSGYSKIYSSTASSGAAAFDLTAILLTKAGTYTYVATSGDLAETKAFEAVVPGPGSEVAVAGIPTAVAPGQTYNFLVSVLDQYRNPASSFNGTVNVVSTDTNATLSPMSYTFVAADAGAHPFSVFFNTGGVQTVTGMSGSLSAGSETGITVGNSLWIMSADTTRARLNESGSVLRSGVGTPATSATSVGQIAIDALGNVWSVAQSSNTLTFSTSTGTASAWYTGGGLNLPVGIAVDGGGNLWIANQGSSSVSEFTLSGTAASPPGGFPAGGAESSGIAVDLSGSVWVTNPTANTVTRILGAAVPVTAPISSAVGAYLQGSRP